MLSYDIQMKILSKLPLWELHKNPEFQQAKNDKLYELCFDEIKAVSQYHRDHWKNTIYAGPRHRGSVTLSKTYRHFMLFLAECVALYRLTFELSSFEPLNFESGTASLNYTYLADQGMLGLCCRLYPEFLPSTTVATKFKQWTKVEDRDGADYPIIGLTRPCWYLNYDRQLWQSMYPRLEFSNEICEFLGFDLNYLTLHLDQVKNNDERTFNLIFCLVEETMHHNKQVIFNHVVYVLEFLKGIIDPGIKAKVKQLILRQIDPLISWAMENL